MIGTGRSGKSCRGQQDPTHFGRMLQDLGIGFIAAQSPRPKAASNASGAPCRTASSVNCACVRSRPLSRPTRFSRSSCPPSFGASRAPPRSPPPAWRPAPRDLDRLLSCRYTRVVARDNTVRLGARWLQIPPGPRGHSYAGCRVELRELLDGRLVVLYQDTLLAVQPAPASPFVLTPRSDPGRDRQRMQHSPRAGSRHLQAAVVALTRTLRSRRPTPAPAVAASAPNGEPSGGAPRRDRSGVAISLSPVAGQIPPFRETPRAPFPTIPGAQPSRHANAA